MDKVLKDIEGGKLPTLRHVEPAHDASAPKIEPGGRPEGVGRGGPGAQLEHLRAAGAQMSPSRALPLGGGGRKQCIRPHGALHAPESACAAHALAQRRALRSAAVPADATPPAPTHAFALCDPPPGTHVNTWDKDALLQGIEQGEPHRAGAQTRPAPPEITPSASHAPPARRRRRPSPPPPVSSPQASSSSTLRPWTRPSP
jgi:hypothetical protein